MSSNSKKSLIERLRRGKKTRARLIDSNLAETIAFQIRATRSARDWTQADLARETGMTQNNLSRMESEDYGKHSITSLKRIAEAFDVALDVRFVPYSQYVDWLSGTPHLDKGLSPEALAVPSFDDEEKSGQYDTNFQYFSFSVIPQVAPLEYPSIFFATDVSPQPYLNSIEWGGLYQRPVEAKVPMLISDRKVA